MEILDGTDSTQSNTSLLLEPHVPVSQPRGKKPKKPQKRHWLHRRSVRALNRLFDVHLLGSFEFRVLLASAFLYPMGLNIPFVYSKTRTTIPQQYAQWIGPAIGATNFIARILCGFVAYKLRDWTSYICGGGLLLGGTMVFISAFYGSDVVWFQLAYGLIYGVAPGVNTYLVLPLSLTLATPTLLTSLCPRSCFRHTARPHLCALLGPVEADQRLRHHRPGHGHGRLYWHHIWRLSCGPDGRLHGALRLRRRLHHALRQP